MRVVLRADAGVAQGTGHVMRCLTLAEALLTAGHEALLATNLPEIPWLRAAVDAAGVRVVPATPDRIELEELAAAAPDRIVVDSYRIPAADVASARTVAPVLAVVDGSLRGIVADWYLEQNLGSEEVEWRLPAESTMLAGTRYALVRDAILRARRPTPWRTRGSLPRVLAFLGGSDPRGLVLPLARSLAALEVELAVIARPEHGEALEGVGTIIAPTPELPMLLGQADLVVSAAGTSAWDLCALGVPSVLLATVDNQRVSLHRAVADGLALGIDLVAEGDAAIDRAAGLVAGLLADESARREISQRASAAVDGNGKIRVVRAIEAAP